MFAVLSPATSFVQQWLNDPQATSTVLVAVVGGGFALYRFRAVPQERRRETLDAMQHSYELSRVARGQVLQTMPAFLALGREAVERVAREARPNRTDLVRQMDDWSGSCDTAAHEIVASEAKFRSMLWAINEISGQLGREGWSPDSASPSVAEQVSKGQQLVNGLNNFAQMVELNLFPQGDVLGQLHRSIAPACKAVEPLIWERNVVGGRWGLRVIRLMLRAEYYNDAKEIHRSSDLVWVRAGGDLVLIRSALYRSDYGRHVPTARLAEMSWRDRASLGIAAVWTRVRPQSSGTRLRRHVRAENDLVGRLRFARQAGMGPLDLGWDMTVLERKLERHWAAGGDAHPQRP